MGFLFPKKIVIGVSAAWLSAVAGYAVAESDENRVLFQATPSDRLYGLDFHGDAGVAVGEAGFILRSSDGGQSWTREDAPTSLALSNIASNGEREIAIGQMGLILVKEASGSWREVDSGTNMRLLNVDLNREGLGIVVGAFGTLLRTTDGGETWASIAPPWAPLYDDGTRSADAAVRDEPSNYVVKVFEDGRIIVGGEYGMLLESMNRGDSWEVLYRSPEVGGAVAPTIFDMQFTAGRGFAVGQNGLVMRTDDAGKSWQLLETPVDASLFAVGLAGDGRVFAVGQRAAIASSDGGQRWQTISSLDFELNWYAGAGQGPSLGSRMVAIGHSARIVSVSAFGE